MNPSPSSSWQGPDGNLSSILVHLHCNTSQRNVGMWTGSSKYLVFGWIFLSAKENLFTWGDISFRHFQSQVIDRMLRRNIDDCPIVAVYEFSLFLLLPCNDICTWLGLAFSACARLCLLFYILRDASMHPLRSTSICRDICACTCVLVRVYRLCHACTCRCPFHPLHLYKKACLYCMVHLPNFTRVSQGKDYLSLILAPNIGKHGRETWWQLRGWPGYSVHPGLFATHL